MALELQETHKNLPIKNHMQITAAAKNPLKLKRRKKSGFMCNLGKNVCNSWAKAALRALEFVPSGAGGMKTPRHLPGEITEFVECTCTVQVAKPWTGAAATQNYLLSQFTWIENQVEGVSGISAEPAGLFRQHCHTEVRQVQKYSPGIPAAPRLKTLNPVLILLRVDAAILSNSLI